MSDKNVSLRFDKYVKKYPTGQPTDDMIVDGIRIHQITKSGRKSKKLEFECRAQVSDDIGIIYYEESGNYSVVNFNQINKPVEDMTANDMMYTTDKAKYAYVELVDKSTKLTEQEVKVSLSKDDISRDIMISKGSEEEKDKMVEVAQSIKSDAKNLSLDTIKLVKRLTDEWIKPGYHLKTYPWLKSKDAIIASGLKMGIPHHTMKALDLSDTSARVHFENNVPYLRAIIDEGLSPQKAKVIEENEDALVRLGFMKQPDRESGDSIMDGFDRSLMNARSVKDFKVLVEYVISHNGQLPNDPGEIEKLAKTNSIVQVQPFCDSLKSGMDKVVDNAMKEMNVKPKTEGQLDKLKTLSNDLGDFIKIVQELKSNIDNKVSLGLPKESSDENAEKPNDNNSKKK